MGGRSDEAKRALWRRRLKEFEAGQSTVAEFCRRVGVSPATFYEWRRKLAPAARSQSRPMNFVPVEITAAARVIEVLLPGGARVLIPAGESEALRAVFSLLVAQEARAC
jgi:transposase-like protein